MKIAVDEEMKRHLGKILSENKSAQEWAEVASSDQFQSQNYCGGFDETEMEFTFSFYNDDRTEYWFQFPLSAVQSAISSPSFSFEARLADI